MPRQLSMTAARTLLTRAAGLVGADHVFAAPEDQDAYSDAFAFDAAQHRPAGAIAPASAEEVQAVVRLANETGAPIWPVSRGKNLAYGGSAPVLPGTIVLDLSRMRRILEIDVKRGLCVLEPGVGFFDLFAELEKMGHPLWMSVPGNAWGSVVGNALERGVGAMPYGDHSAQVCGLEVVLGDGSMVRTGSGAMAGSKTWHATKNAYGPAWDAMFCQSNFGVVTRMGLWLMPAPEATATIDLSLAEPGDLGKGIDLLQPLRLKGLLDHDVAWVSYVGIASYVAPRRKWFEGEGPMPEAVGARIRQELGIGWWSAQANFYGEAGVVAAKAEAVRAALQPHFDKPLQVTRWKQGDPFEKSRAGIPATRDMTMIDWLGGRGGHVGFSPILPADGAVAQRQFDRTRARYAEAELDYYGAFSVGARALIAVNEILYTRDNPAHAKAVPQLMSHLIADSAAAGFCEYRTHLDQMDEVAATFDWGDHAMMKLNQRLKDAVDPAGILAPGKQGIWPVQLRT